MMGRAQNPPGQAIRTVPGNGPGRPTSAARSPDEESASHAGVVEEGTGPKENEAMPAVGDDRYRRLVENSYDMILTLDLGGMVLAANPAAERILGFSPDELAGTNIMERLVPGEVGRAGALFARIAAGARSVREEFEHVAKEGRRVFLDVSAYPVEHDGQLIGVEGIARDVTEQRWLREALAHQALHDPLTGLSNRRLFFDRLAQALARAERRSSTVAVMLLDLDDFKRINDSFGHALGDEVLVAVARRLARDLRRSESVMRLGGDEFALIVEDVTTESELAVAAGRILSAMADPLAVDDRVGQATASVGIALAERGDDAGALLGRADIAMYQVKAEGGGRVGFYSQQIARLPQPKGTRPPPVSRR